MTRQLALEGSEHGIRINSISPGFIETNSTRGELEDEEFGRQMRDRTLLGRFGQAEDIANAALYLASDESSYITVWVPKSYATRRYSWITPLTRSRRRTRMWSRSATLSGSGRSGAAWFRVRCGRYLL